MKYSNVRFDETHDEIVELYNKIGHYGTQENQDLSHEHVYYEQKIMQNRGYLDSLCEMKVVFLYKSLELNINFLVRTAYPEVDARSLYRIDIVKSFLKNKEINFTVLEGYQEFEELRKINNSIKHSGKVNDGLKKIKEFEDKDYLDHESLELFYTRVKLKVQDFIKHLKDEIKKDLFEFSDTRLDKLVRYNYEHMGKEAYLKFIEKMKEKVQLSGNESGF